MEKRTTSDFDVFLCHNSNDKPLVKHIAKKLKEKGIIPWLDEWELRPGFPWQEALEEQIEQIKSAAVFVGKNGVGPWENRELRAFLDQFVKRGLPVIPVILSDCEEVPNLPLFLRFMTWVDFQKNEPDPMKQLIWGITGKRSTDNNLDRGEAPDDISDFFGRIEELRELEQWIIGDKCRLVALLGMGGIGKTALSVKFFFKSIQNKFDYRIWRSLREAPCVEKILADLIKFLSNQHETELPDTVGESVTRLIHYLQRSRCLLVLDNAESILQGGTQLGQYREGYEGYGTLIQRVGESWHQSCLVITSREKPKEVAKLEEPSGLVRSLELQGLKDDAGQKFLNKKGLTDVNAQWKRVFDYYSGNPFALKIVASTIRNLFDGDIDKFFDQEARFFDDILNLLEQQVNRLSEVGQSVMYWLAINREATAIKELKKDIIAPVSTQELIETLDSLKRRSLIECNTVGFTLQNVMMEYLTDRFVSNIAEEINTQKISLLRSHSLIKATAKDYIKENQIRLLLKPIIALLLEFYYNNENEIKKQLDRILSIFRDKLRLETGYTAGNILNILCWLQGIDLSGYNFSHLFIRQAYLENISLRNVNFSHSNLTDSVFSKPFNVVFAIAYSPDGKTLVTGHNDGKICLWDIKEGKQIINWEGHDSWINSVAFCPPNGRILASSSNGGSGGKIVQTLKLWDTETGSLIKSLEGQFKTIHSVAFSPDGRNLASGGVDCKIRLWDVILQEAITETFLKL